MQNKIRLSLAGACRKIQEEHRIGERCHQLLYRTAVLRHTVASRESAECDSSVVAAANRTEARTDGPVGSQRAHDLPLVVRGRRCSVSRGWHCSHRYLATKARG